VLAVISDHVSWVRLLTPTTLRCLRRLLLRRMANRFVYPLFAHTKVPVAFFAFPVWARGDPVISGFRRICPRSVPPVVRGDLRDSLSLHPRACQRVTKEATCLPWVAHPHWRMRGSWWLREGVAAATLDQYTILARNSSRRAVSVTHTDQSAGHAKPWNHAFKVFFSYVLHTLQTLCLNM
jgi:hypothetical protein